MCDTDQLLDEIVKKIRLDAISTFPGKELAARLSEYRQSPTRGDIPRRVVSGRPSWRLIGASALAASLLAWAVWVASMASSGVAFAFADVKEAVDTARTIQYRVLHYSQDPNYLRQYNLKAGEPAISQVICSGDRIRNEMPLGMVSVVDPKRGLMMATWASNRRAVIEPIPQREALKAAADFRDMLRDISGTNAKKLPDRAENGRTLSEFVVRMHDRAFTVTVDPQTKLPIRMEVVYQKNPEQGQMADMREVYTDFIFDAPVDEALFRIEAPAGYAVENHVMQRTPAQPPASMDLTVSAEDGIGPVRFGTKVADIVRMLGEPDWRREIPHGVTQEPSSKPDTTLPAMITTELDYHRRGFSVMANDHNGLYVIHCKGTDDDAFRGGTKEGIALGASWDDVTKVYGKPEAQLKSHRMFYPRLGYEFEFRDKKVVAIQVTRPNPDIVMETQADGTVRERFEQK